MNSRTDGLDGEMDTVAVGVISTLPLTVAETCTVSTTVSEIVPVVTPLELVGDDGCVIASPTPSLDSVTVAPWIGLPRPSFTVTVIVDAVVGTAHPVLHAVIDPGEGTTVDCDADGPPGAMSKLCEIPDARPELAAVSV